MAGVGGVHHQAQIFLLKFNHESGLEIALDHLLAQHFEGPRIGGASGQRLMQRRQV
jgi:hypothetical protein